MGTDDPLDNYILSLQDDNEENYTNTIPSENDPLDEYISTLSPVDTQQPQQSIQDEDPLDNYINSLGPDPVQMSEQVPGESPVQPGTENAIFYDEIDPETAKIQQEMGQLWYNDKGAYERHREKYEKNLEKFNTVYSDKTPEEKAILLKDPLVIEELDLTEPVLHRGDKSISLLRQDPETKNIEVVPQDSGDQYSKLARETGIGTPDMLTKEETVKDVISEYARNSGINEFVQNYKDEKKREEIANKNRSKWASLGAGLVDGVKTFSDSFKGLSAAIGATITSGGNRKVWKETFDGLKKQGVFNDIENKLGIKFSKDFYDKRADNSLMGQVVRGLGTGIVDIAALHATAGLGLLNFPVHSAIKTLSKDNIRSLSEVGANLVIGGAEGYLMDRILHFAPKMFPKASLKAFGKSIPIGYQQAGVGLSAVAGSELTHAMFDPDSEMSMKDRFANFFTMALMSGRSKGPEMVIGRKGGKTSKPLQGKIEPKQRKIIEDSTKKMVEIDNFVKENINDVTIKDKIINKLEPVFEKAGIFKENVNRNEVLDNIANEYIAQHQKVQIKGEKGLGKDVGEVYKQWEKGLISDSEGMAAIKKFVPSEKEIKFEKREAPEPIKRGRIEESIDRLKVEARGRKSPEEMRLEDPKSFEATNKEDFKGFKKDIETFKEAIKREKVGDKAGIEAVKQFEKKRGFNKLEVGILEKISNKKYGELTELEQNLISNSFKDAKGTFKAGKEFEIATLTPDKATVKTAKHEILDHGLEEAIRRNDPKMHFSLGSLYGSKTGKWTSRMKEAFQKDVEAYRKTGKFKDPRKEMLLEKYLKKTGNEAVIGEMKAIKTKEVPDLDKTIVKEPVKEAPVKKEVPDLDKTIVKEPVKEVNYEKNAVHMKTDHLETVPKESAAIETLRKDGVDVSEISDIKVDRVINKEVSADSNTTTYAKELNNQANELIKNLGGYKKASKVLIEKEAIGAVDQRAKYNIMKEARSKKDYQTHYDIARNRVLKGSEEGRALQARKVDTQNIVHPDNVYNTLNHLENLALSKWDNVDSFKKALKKKTGSDSMLSFNNVTKWVKKAQKIDQMPNKTKKEMLNRNRAEAKLVMEIGNKIPKRKGEYWNSVQVIAQLMNAKTLLRNVVGNRGFFATETISQNTLGSALDIAAKQFTGIRGLKKEEGSYKELRSKRKIDKKQIKDMFKEYADHQVEQIDVYIDGLLGESGKARLKEQKIKSGSEGGKYDISPEFIWKDLGDNIVTKKMAAGVSRLEKALKWGLLYPDRVALNRRMKQSMEQQMESYNANLGKGEKKLTEPTGEMAAEGIIDGLHGTFQDTNKITEISTGIKKMANKLNIGGYGFGELLNKYPKTPANLIHRGYEYSPLGLAVGIKKTVSAIKNIKKMQSDNRLILDKLNSKTKLTNKQMFEAMTLQRKAIQKLTRGMVGSSLIGLGYSLASKGVITPSKSPDKKKKALMEAMGIRPYSFLGKYSLDWFQPIIDPILVGADMQQEISNAKDKNMITSLGAVGNAVINLTNFYLESSGKSLEGQGVVKGVKTLFKGGEGSLKNGLVQLASSAPASFIPTFLSQARYAVDPKLREVYKRDGNVLKTMFRSIGNKLPFVSKQLSARKDITGKDLRTSYTGEDLNPLEWGINAMIAFGSPGIVSKVKKDKPLMWLLKNYDDLGNARAVFADKRYTDTFTYKKDRYKLPETTKNEYLKSFYEEVETGLEKIMDSNNYKNSPYGTKMTIIKKIYSEAAKKVLRRTVLYGKVKKV